MKFLITALALFSSTNAFASPAVSYDCAGKNFINGESVVFELLFADHGREEGYTNQSVTLTKVGGIALEKQIVLQMYGAGEKNKCQKNENGEIYMPGAKFQMDPTRKGNIAAYQVSFQSKCGAEAQFDVKAYCFLTH